MAIQTLSIKTSGGDATTAAGAEALVSNGTDDWGLEYQEAMTDTTACVINAAMTTGSIRLTVAAAYRHNGTLTHSGAKLSGSGNPQLQVDTDNVTVEWLHVATSAAGNTYALYCQNNTVDNLRIRHCLIDRNANSGFTAALHIVNVPTKAIVEYCYVRSNGGCVPTYSTRADFVNCTFHYSGAGVAYGIDDNATGNTRAINCIVTGTYTTAAYRSSVVAIGTGNNAGSDTSAPGTTVYDSFPASALVNVGAGDPHWDDAATAALYPGADASAYLTGAQVDIDGDVVAASVWDIGCDQERVAAGGSADHSRLGLGLGLGL